MTLVSEFFSEDEKKYSSISIENDMFVVKYYTDGEVTGTYSTDWRQDAEGKAEEHVLGYIAQTDPDEYQGGVEYFG